MPGQLKLKSRYELKEALGQGGMGVVYKAYDAVVKRDVAVKTLRGIPSRNALQLFQKECEVLGSLCHPNIVEIFDVGEFEEQGERKPFLVMPLLPGMALDKLIHNSSDRLTVERSVEIITQACRGLHAAHERGLVHRDLKPSNIFVMRDDSVKIIDFGVALMVDSRTTRGQKGTLLYMAPEQIEMKPLSALSDIFSLGVVCYETFTQRQPFERPSESEIADAILHQFPRPASDLNPKVSQNLSRVIHKAMAKQPWHRFSNAREFAETLGKALRNEPIEFFDPSRIQPRIQRARRAFEQADYQFSAEILSELEAEGHLDAEISELRRQIDQAARQKTIRQLLESARSRLEEDEYPLALQKIQEVLQLDPENASALGLKSTIENKRTERKIEDWFRLAHQHISNHAYSHARQALQNVLQIRPKESLAQQLLAEVDRREHEYVRLRQEKEQTYKAAQEAWQNGEISDALSRMGVVLELERRSPETTSPERTATYQNFYNRVRSEHDALNDAYAEARKHLADRDFTKALALCNTYLAKYPGNALLQALKFDVEEQQRQEWSAYIADVDRRVETEHDLVKRVGILEEALERYPGEDHFERSLHLVREKRDLVDSIVAKARHYEERGQFVGALSQWEILRTIYQQFPGLDFEIERVVKRRDQQARIDSKARWIKQIEQPLQWGDYARATELSKQAQAEFPNDPELAELERQANQGLERAERVQTLLTQGQELVTQHRFEEGVDALRKAYELDSRNALVRATLSDALAQQAHGVLESDWRSAEALIEQALEINPGHALAKSLRTLAADRKRQEFVDRCLSQARQLQAAGELARARAEVEKGLSSYPNEPRLSERRAALARELGQSPDQQTRLRDLQELRTLLRDSDSASDPESVQVLSVRAQTVAKRYPDDPEFQLLAASVGRRVATLTPRPEVEGQGEHKQTQPRPKVDAAREPKGIPPWAWVAAGAVVIVGGVVAAVWYLMHPPPRPPAPPVEVPSQAVTAKADSTSPVEVKLEPLPLVLRISSDLEGSAVRLDDLDKGTTQAQKDLALNVEPGPPHTLTIVSGKIEVAIPFEAKAASLPVLSAPMTTSSKFKGTVLVVTGWGTQAHVESNVSSLRVRVGDTPPQKVGSGVDLDLSGSHDLLWGEGKNERKTVLQVGEAPTLTVLLDAGRKGGPPDKGPRLPGPTPPKILQPVAPTNAKGPDISELYQRAYGALNKKQYAEPPGDNGIYYALEILKINKDDTSGKQYLENGVQGGQSQVHDALKKNDLAAANRISDAMAKLLGDDKVAGLREDIRNAGQKANQPRKEPAPSISYRVKHLHQKAGAFCEGILSVNGADPTLPHLGPDRLKFNGESASVGEESHKLDFACSDVEIKKQKVLGKSAVRVRKGPQNENFVPEDDTNKVVSALKKACSK